MPRATKSSLCGSYHEESHEASAGSIGSDAAERDSSNRERAHGSALAGLPQVEGASDGVSWGEDPGQQTRLHRGIEELRNWHKPLVFMTATTHAEEGETSKPSTIPVEQHPKKLLEQAL